MLGSAQMPPGAGRRALFAVLDDTRRRLRRAALIEASTLFALSAVGAIVLGTVVAWAGAAIGVVALLQILALTGAVGYAIVRFGVVLGRELRSPEAVAAWLDRATRRAGDAAPSLRSAVELDRDRGHYGESEALADAAVATAAERGQSVDPARVVSRESWPRMRIKLYGLIAGLLGISVLGLLVPEAMRTAFGAIGALGEIEDVLAPPPPEPRFGDFRVTYRPPAYAHRPTRTAVSPTGDLRALPGTEVIIETRARHALREATLIVQHGTAEDGGASRTAAEVSDRELRASFVITRGGRYRFRVTTTDGQVLEERRGRAIELEPDTPPEVVLRSPTESPKEVNEGERVELAFSAEDDFGLGDVEVAWRVLGTTREGRQLLSTGARGKRRFLGQGQLDLAKLEVGAGDRIAYSIEVKDSDTVNGPKIGASATQELRIYSKEAHHAAVMEQQEHALDELVHILGDDLEGPIAVAEPDVFTKSLEAAERVVTRGNDAVVLLGEVVKAIRDDPLGRKEVATAFDRARRDLKRHNRAKSNAVGDLRRRFDRSKAADASTARRAAAAQDVMIEGLERNVVYLADLLNDQRMLDAEMLTKQLREQQQALRDALEDYKRAPSDEKRETLARAIREIKQRISEIAAKMQKLQGSIPQDFVNKDALETKDTMEGMERVQSLIEQGDLDSAMAELERMLNDTEQMLSQMKEGREELGEREYSEVQEQAKELWKDLGELEKKQRELARKTDEHARAAQERVQSKIGAADETVDKLQKKLDEIQKHLEASEDGLGLADGDPHDQAKRRIDDAKRALAARDFGAAKDMAEQADKLVEQLEQDAERRAEHSKRFGDFMGSQAKTEQAARELQQAKPKMKQVKAELDKMIPKPGELLSKEERAELDALKKEQEGLEGEAKQLGEKLGKLGQQLPMVGEGTPEILDEAKGAMRESSSGLGEGDAPGAQGQQRRALDALNRFREALQQMGQGGQGGGQGGGMPLPFAPPSGGGQPGGQGMDGRDPRSMDKVEIPQPEQYRAPAEFREEILEAAKQGTAESYREAVRRYYEEIVK